MKVFEVTIKIIGLGGEQVRTHEIKAKTIDSATKKAWQIIGNQTGEVLYVGQTHYKKD